MDNETYNESAGQLRCPRCGGFHLQPINQQVVTGKITDNRRNKGFGCCKGLLGAACLGPFGWLLGLCGMGKTKGKFTDTRQYSNKIVFICMDCGNQFEGDI